MVSPQTKIIGLILAGGEAKRFGGGKCLAKLKDLPLLSWVYQALKPWSHEIWLSVREFGQLERAQLPPIDRVVLDRHPGAGPAVALAEILAANPEVIFLVAPCDQPFLQGKLLAFLLKEAQAQKKAVFCQDERGRLLPFPGVFPGGIKIQGRSFREGIAPTERVIIGPRVWRQLDPEGLSFFNVNYQRDLKEAQRLIILLRADLPARTSSQKRPRK